MAVVSVLFDLTIPILYGLGSWRCRRWPCWWRRRINPAAPGQCPVWRSAHVRWRGWWWCRKVWWCWQWYLIYKSSRVCYQCKLVNCSDLHVSVPHPKALCRGRWAHCSQEIRVMEVTGAHAGLEIDLEHREVGSIPSATKALSGFSWSTPACINPASAASLLLPLLLLSQPFPKEPFRAPTFAAHSVTSSVQRSFLCHTDHQHLTVLYFFFCSMSDSVFPPSLAVSKHR